MAMKTLFLLCWLCPLFLSAQQRTPSSKHKYVLIRNNYLFNLMTSELTTKKLRAVYNKNFRIGQTAKNIHGHKARDTVLVANTLADKVSIFKNKYATYLISAELTSDKFSFGHGIRIGATKATFCKAFGLSTNYDTYEIAIFPEASVGISFAFKKDILIEVEYRIIYDVD